MRPFSKSLIIMALSLATAACATPDRHGSVGGFPYPATHKPSPEEIQHVPTGLKITQDDLFTMIGGSRIVYVGEAHDSVNAHRVQLDIIRALHQHSPGKIAIGMEMFRTPQQLALNRWTEGKLTEVDFLKEANWYGNWKSDFGYYRDILNFAKDYGLDVVALNPSKVLQKEVSRSGIGHVSPEIRAQLPEIAEMDPYQRMVLKGLFSGHDQSKGKVESMMEVLSLWEESMAENVVDYLSSKQGRDKQMVVITGAWHVQYGFGVPKKVLRRLPVSYAIVLPRDITDDSHRKKHPGREMKVDLPEIPLLIADFIWMVEYKQLVSDKPKLGVWVSDQDGPVLIHAVAKGSPAEKAGILIGDEVLRFDGQSIHRDEDVYLYVSQKKVGDSATLSIRRNGKELNIDVKLFRITGQQP